MFSLSHSATSTSTCVLRGMSLTGGEGGSSGVSQELGTGRGVVVAGADLNPKPKKMRRGEGGSDRRAGR